MSELPKGWAATRLGELADYINGAAFKPTDWHEEGMPIIRIQNLIDEDKPLNRTMRKVAEKYVVCDGDILVSWSATLDAFIWNRGEALLNQHIFRVLPNQELTNKRFLFYLLKKEIAALFGSEHLHGSTMKHINRGPFLSHKIFIPPRKEQDRIVAKLDSLFSRSRRAREELERVPRLIERYKQAVLAAAFRGDLTADWREANAKNSTAKDFLIEAGISTLNEDSLPSLPNSWSWVLAGNLCNIKSGVTLGKKRVAGTQLIELPYLRVANVQRGWLNLDEIKTVLVTPKEAEALYLNSGDILMNEGGDRDKLGRGWVWQEEIKNCIHQNHVFRLRLKTNEIPSRYISYYANEFGQKYFMDQGKQTTNLASISMSKLSNFPLPIAPPEEMELIIQLIEELFKSIDWMQQEYQKASSLSDRLEQATLFKAFKGELVPQDSNDEPASVLLERIQAERTKQEPKAKGAKKATSRSTAQRSRKTKQQNSEPIQLGLKLE